MRGGGDIPGDRAYDLGFFLVEAFAALEVTAVIVAAPRIAAGLALRPELSSWILDSYLYPLFALMAVILALSRRISRRAAPLHLFLWGLALFAAGNLVCAGARASLAFFAGRGLMGAGGAVAFAGQLWTASLYHRRRITRPLVWGEVGATLGVVAGPVAGALFAQASPQGWRLFFLLNAGLALAAALCARAGLRGRPAEEAPEGAFTGDPGLSLAWTMTAWQAAVSILIVGGEYLCSDYLQVRAGRSPLLVGALGLMAALGAVLGSLWAAGRERRLDRLPAFATAGLLAAVAALAGCLASGSFLLAGVPFLGAGVCMGLASVSTYALLVRASPPAAFLSRSMLYLLGMQIGNALGVQAVGLAEVNHLGVWGTTVLLAALPAGIMGWILARGRGRKAGMPD